MVSVLIRRDFGDKFFNCSNPFCKKLLRYDGIENNEMGRFSCPDGDESVAINFNLYGWGLQKNKEIFEEYERKRLAGELSDHFSYPWDIYQTT